AGESRETALEAVRNGGGRTLTGGKGLDGDGFYLAPSLVELEDFGSPLAREEVFAPVSALLKVHSADEAVRVANDVRYGLAAAVFTNDLDEAMKVADRIEAGLLKINGSTAGVDYHAPFGGIKQSGVGTKEQGLAARDFFTESKTVLLSP
ncbi:MAG: aldehyde dehydrogenase, partial [Actinobacteria bacterium]